MTFPVPGGATFLRARNNLSDVGSGSAAMLNLDDYYATQQLASGEGNLPRFNISSGQALVSGTMHCTFWTAQKTETINNIVGNVSSAAAGATPTYCAMGLYSVDGSGNLTLVGQCANDTTLFAATFTSYSRPVTVPFTKTAGQRYAFGYLVVSAAAMPQMIGYNGTTTLAQSAPRLCGVVTGLASLPASVLAANVFSSASMNYGAVTP